MRAQCVLAGVCCLLLAFEAAHAAEKHTRKTAIVGESLAGLFVIETLLLEPDLFDTYCKLCWRNAPTAVTCPPVAGS